MVGRSRIRLLGGALTILSLMILSGCALPPYEGPPPGGYPPSYYDYYYYPDEDVYYQIHTGWYFYNDHGRWLRVQQLPPHMRLDMRRRYPLTIHEQEPWQRHDEHRRKYPPPPERPREEHAPGGMTPRPPGAAEREHGRPPPEIRGGPRPEPAPQRPDRRAPSSNMGRGLPPALEERRSPPTVPRSGASPTLPERRHEDSPAGGRTPRPPGAAEPDRRAPSPDIRRSGPPAEQHRGVSPARPAPPPPEQRRDRDRDRDES